MKDAIDFAPQALTDRPLMQALGRGWRRRCPGCGGGPMFEGYLKVRRNCASCGEPLHHHRADDIPTWGVLLVTCKLLGIGLLYLEFAFSPPVWVHWALWPVVMVALVLWLLPRMKGAVVGFQWAQRMYGFGGSDHAPAGG